MAKAKKLPSGSWQCLVYSHTEKVLDKKTGIMKDKRIYESFTSTIPGPAGKRDAELQAAKFAADKERKNTVQNDMTFGEALDAYIKSREAVLSPKTIMEYRGIAKRNIKSLHEIKLRKLSQEDIQEAINHETLHHSPKTIRNIHGLISAVLGQYRPDIRLATVLPKKVRPDLYIPSDDEIQCLIQHVTGTDMELPILLAAFGPMRRGEISALTMDNISGNRVHVCQNMVLNEQRKWIIKQPKSYAGDRFIDYPDFVAEKWQGLTGNVTALNPNVITARFWHILKNAKLPHFRFHDLRHYSASIQHALGIPDAYIMQRGGWQTDGTLKAIYRHTMSDRQAEMNQIANGHFEELCNTKYNTKKKNP